MEYALLEAFIVNIKQLNNINNLFILFPVSENCLKTNILFCYRPVAK
jgi:hypothetical protein